jgi:CRISPR-associated protein Csc2
LAAIIFSDTELFSNLELTQAVYDLLLGDKDELDFPLADQEVAQAVQSATYTLLQRLVGITPIILHGDTLEQVLDETKALYREGGSVKSFLEDIEKDYQ